MGINAKSEVDKKASLAAKEFSERMNQQRKLECDLKSCMRCKFFWGHDSRCLSNECYKEKQVEQKENEIPLKCRDCSYYKGNGYCFPCMKDIMGRRRNGYGR